MLFADIPGLQLTKEQLIHSAKSGKIPHAQLFQSNEGALKSFSSNAKSGSVACA